MKNIILGFAWSARREAIDMVGGLIDWAILGAADHHMAMALIGKIEKSMYKGLHPNYIIKCLQWQNRCEKYIRRDIGFVAGTIFHHWHGKKKDRKYTERWKIVADNKFDPNSDLLRDWQGLYQLDPERIILRDQIRKYFRNRNEDSIDL